MSLKYKRSRSDDSSHSRLHTFSQKTTSRASVSVQCVIPSGFTDSDSDPAGPLMLSRCLSTSSASLSSLTGQLSLDLLFHPSDVLDIRPIHDDDEADPEDPTSAPVQPAKAEPTSILASQPPPYSPVDHFPLPRYILMAPVRETLVPGQEATALLKALRKEQVLQLKAGHGFAGFNAEELESWANVGD
jgi:hypothetical protein